MLSHESSTRLNTHIAFVVTTCLSVEIRRVISDFDLYLHMWNDETELFECLERSLPRQLYKTRGRVAALVGSVN